MAWMILLSFFPGSGLPSPGMASMPTSDPRLGANRSRCFKRSYPLAGKGEYLHHSMATTFPKATPIGLAEATHRDLKWPERLNAPTTGKVTCFIPRVRGSQLPLSLGNRETRGSDGEGSGVG